MSYSRASSYGHGQGRNNGGDCRSFYRGDPTTKPVEFGNTK
ncbi:MAG TPA: hypothetical protein VFI73_04340 [Candidatus Nitrosopolaris sp.]|nr:hypothetical protein [Candidatus Nitrosopolaris sp.]